MTGPTIAGAAASSTMGRGGPSLWRRLLPALALSAFLSLVVAPAASARPPILRSAEVAAIPCKPPATGTCGQPKASWSLPDGVRSEFVQLAYSPTTDPFGYFLGKDNLIGISNLGSSQLSYTDSVRLPPGTYYLHVAGDDTACESCPRIEFSSTFKVTVSASGTGGATNVGGGSDNKPPAYSASVKRVQDIDKLYVVGSIKEPGTLIASGSVSVAGAGSSKVFKFKTAVRDVAANKRAKLRLRLAKKKQLRAVKRALRRGKRLRAIITVTAKDREGYSASKKVRVRLKD